MNVRRKRFDAFRAIGFSGMGHPLGSITRTRSTSRCAPSETSFTLVCDPAGRRRQTGSFTAAVRPTVGDEEVVRRGQGPLFARKDLTSALERGIDVARAPLTKLDDIIPQGLCQWSGAGSIRGPHAFQARALPTELPDRVSRLRCPKANESLVADLTGFEPATSALTGRRALLAAPQVHDGDGPCFSVGTSLPSSSHSH
jgi:hypothetical protein